MNAKSTKTLNTDLTPEESRDQNELIEKEKKKGGQDRVRSRDYGHRNNTGSENALLCTL